jgi:4-carboxymuconolactone decarboxylase
MPSQLPIVSLGASELVAYPSAMAKLPIVTSDQLSADQERVWQIITGGRRGTAADLTDDDGGLVGPFNAMLISPVIGQHLAALGEVLRFDTSLSRSVVELATIVVGARWRSNFEWSAHSRLALRAGISPEIIEAIRRGVRPLFTDETSDAVYRLVSELLADGRVEDDTYASVAAAVGDVGVVELVALVGYYCLICFSLNTFEIPLRAGETPAWPGR